MRKSRELLYFMFVGIGNAWILPRKRTVPMNLGVTTSSTTFTREEARALQKAQEQKAYAKHDIQAWNSLFLYVPEQPEPTSITESEGNLPEDFPAGCLLRVGPNGASQDDGWFDGDGMVHCITFPPAEGDEKQRAAGTVSATFIETSGRQLEQASNGNHKFRGTLGDVPKGYPMLSNLLMNAWNFRTVQAQKDTCNTALALHGNRLLALMEQCPPSELIVKKDGRVETIDDSCLLDGVIESLPITGGTLSAHGRTCPETGERVHISYRADQAPYLRMDVFDPGFKPKYSVDIDVPVGIMLHDCAITRNYAVVMDLPLTLRNSRLMQNKFPVEYEPDHPARIGLVPRRRDDPNDADPIWFDCEPGVVLHLSNAWESDDGNTVIIQALRSEPPPNICYLSVFAPSFFYEYRLDLQTGKVIEERCLNPIEMVEFPSVSGKLNGKESKFSYCVTVASIGGPLEVMKQPSFGINLDGVVKIATVDDEREKIEKGAVVGRYQLPSRWFGVSEPTVVDKKNGSGEYIVIIATHVPENVTWKEAAKSRSFLSSKVMVLDGDDLNAGPVYAASLPYHVAYGLHSEFIGWGDMR